MHFMSRYTAVLINLVFILISGIVSAQNTAIESCQHQSCIAVVDSGSTGSRLSIYSFDKNTKDNPTKIRLIWGTKVTPGLAAISLTTDALDKYLSDLLDVSPVKNMPIYFYSTAGMRFLSEAEQKKYYKAIQDWFAKKKQWTLLEAKTLTGQEEGLYSWLSVNYLLAVFKHAKPPVGVMDMGGASVQITFPVKNTSKIAADDLVKISIYGVDYTVFSHSFFKLGINQVIGQFSNTKSCFPQNYKLPNSTIAHGNAKQCHSNMTQLVNKQHRVERYVKPAIANNPVGTWYAINAFSKLVFNKPFEFKNDELTGKTLLDQAERRICEKNWHTIKHQHSNNKFFPLYCLQAAYYYTLIVDGYGVNPQNTVHFLPESTNISWTLGVVLCKGGMQNCKK